MKALTKNDRKKVNYIRKNKKTFKELMALGKEYDNTTDPERKAELEKQIKEMCDSIKSKHHVLFDDIEQPNTSEPESESTDIEDTAEDAE